jgi:cysteine desulfurase family protein (TIGR01976 family)
MTLTPHLVEQLRHQFPSLQREVDDRPAVFLDGPAGTQVPQQVIDAISDYLTRMNSNHGGHFATSQDSDEMLAKSHSAVAELLGAPDPDCVFFGANMTSLTFALSRALARTWEPGDEILVTRLEHDANFTPWVLAARDAGATVRYAEINRNDCTLDLDDFRSKLSERTRLVAVGCASNATGSINPVADICRWARHVGAVSFLDAVHFAPHARINVEQLDCDFLACSAYKFFGPHVGIMWGRRELLEELEAYKVRPAPDALPDKWMTGTQNHECIAGTLAAVEYLANLGRTTSGNVDLDLSAALDSAFTSIRDYETDLVAHLLSGLAELPKIRVWGIADASRLDERLPTVSITHQDLTAEQLAKHLGERGIFVWDGNYYALPLTEALGVEPDGMVRVGLVHYNTRDEVDRLLRELLLISQ